MDIGRELQALRKRIDDVERSARLSHASLDNTSIVVKDTAGAVKAHIGMQTDGTVGLVTQDGPAPGAPTAPLLTPTIGGLAVVWDGLLADGTTLPADFDHVTVHVSTSSGFTPSAATFVGTITRSGDGGMLPVTPLPYEPHYVVLVAVSTSATVSDPSAETAATPLQVDGPDLAAGSVTAATIQAGAVTAEKLEAILELATRLVAGDPDGARVELNEDGLRVYSSDGTLVIRFDSADGSAAFTGTITGSTFTGGVLQTATSGQRITLNESATNKILVYDSTGRAVAELSALGLGLIGSGGAKVVIDPNAVYPNLHFTNAAGTSAAVMNVVEGTDGVADIGINSGQFSGNGYTDVKWRTFFGNDAWVAERVRDSNTSTTIGGRIYLSSTYSNLSFANSTDTTQATSFFVQGNLAYLSNGRLQVLPPASTSSALFIQADAAHTGNLVRVSRNSVDYFKVDASGNTNAAGILTAGNIAAGRVTITPSAANTPTSLAVTGLTLTGTNIRVVATPSTTVPGSSVLGVGVTGATNTGFTLWLTRTNTTATAVDWIAYGV